MIGLELIKYSLKNLYMRKSRSLLTVLSIFIGIATIFIFISFGIGLHNYVNELGEEAGIDKFFIQAKGVGAPGLDTTFKIKESDLNVVDKTVGVKETLPMYFKTVEVEKDKKKKFVFGIGYQPTPQNRDLLSDMMTVDIAKGRNLKKGDMGKVVLGHIYSVDNKIFENGIIVGNKLIINGKKFDVIGFYKTIGNPHDDSNIYMTDEDLKKLFPDEDLSFALIFGSVNEPRRIDQTVNRIEKALRKERGLEEGKEDFFVRTYEDAIEQFGVALNIIIGFIVLIALVSVFISAINTANTMVTSVLERTKEIGIMKAIGATNSEIRNLFLFESSFLGAVAGVIGVIIGWSLSALGGRILDQLGWGFLTPDFPLVLFVGSIVFATLVGTISGVIVAIQASRQNPVDSLRYE